jgi:hypothetical protein
MRSLAYKGYSGKEGAIAVRKAAAQALACLAAAQPHAVILHWEQIGRLVREPERHKHNDQYASSDCGHNDTHTDSGIGLPWPKKPTKPGENPLATTGGNLDF